MWRYIIKRLLVTIPVLICIAIAVFTLLYFTPGDPAKMLLSSDATEEQLAEKRAQLGLDQPYIVQLGNFLVELFLHGNLGTSYQDGTPVMYQLMLRFPRTIYLALMTMILNVVIGIPLGMAAATHKNKFADYFCTTFAMLTSALPGFWIAMLFVLLFALQLGWFPAGGVDSWKGYVLPTICAGLGGIGQLGRMTRSQMLEVINADYCVTARSQGISENSILYKHALPNALIPIITSVGTHFANSLGGSVVIENVFTIPGVGQYMIEGLNARDYPVTRGGVVLLAALFCIIMLIVDLIYAFIDPRIKAQYSQKRKKKVRVKA